MKVTHEYLITQLDIKVPHVVILGAGASRATCPTGDKNGKVLPLMHDLIREAGLTEILTKHGIKHKTKDFEKFYSKIFGKSKFDELISELESNIERYFLSLELPDHPTIYDHLILSLRPKDFIATFNWDPLLVQAIHRNRHFVEPPGIVFLHGNVGVGFCEKDGMKGDVNGLCPECYEPYAPMKLLYPVDKDYTKDTFLKTQWDGVQSELNRGFMLSVFGYSAPKTDVEAVKLLKKAWTSHKAREILQTEIIDKKKEDILMESWKEFTYSHHYDTWQDFYESWIPRHPRRTCEAMHAPTSYGFFVDDFPIPKELGFDELYEWLTPLVDAERKAENSKFTNVKSKTLDG